MGQFLFDAHDSSTTPVKGGGKTKKSQMSALCENQRDILLRGWQHQR
jgi:hypothetical protein